jgi:hypothetical protein
MTLFQNFNIDDQLKESLKKNGIHIPTYNIFDDENAICFEEKSYVNENLIPVVEYKITVNKESLQDHRNEWENLFSTHYGKVISCPQNWDLVLMERYLREGILNKFRKYIMQPVMELQHKILGEDE